MNLFGNDLFGNPVEPPSRGVVSDRFIMPPFSVLNARDGAWQYRKMAWASLGIRGEVGRSENLLKYSESASLGNRDTSIFDPVVCELAYSWFCPSGGQVVDPFAGGSVRGIVAGSLGFRYWGCDLRQEQIEENEKQADEIQPKVRPQWVVGDSLAMIAEAPPADFVFSCPPYGDLEKYSDDPHDLSAMDPSKFDEAYSQIIRLSVLKMRPDSFACFVVGDYRDKRGLYRGFVGKTVEAFEKAGAGFYNDAILVTSVGSASMRVNRQFAAGRKLVKTHQNVLVFVKGSPRSAAAKISNPSSPA